MNFTTILVPFDFSSHAIKALETAVDMTLLGAKTIHILHVVENLPESGQSDELLQRRTVDSIKEKLSAALEGARKKCPNLQTHIEIGKADQVIVQFAEMLKVDLIVMGSHGTSSVTRVFYGPTTYNVSRKVACSVFILKEPE